MRRALIGVWIFVAVAIALVGFMWWQGAHAPGPPLTLLYVNNLRGTFLPIEANTMADKFRLADLREIDARIEALASQGAAAGPVVFVAGGNSLAGSDGLSRYFRGEPVAAVLHSLHCAALAPDAQELLLGSQALNHLSAATGLPWLATTLAALPGRPALRGVDHVSVGWGGQSLAIFGFYERPRLPGVAASTRVWRDVDDGRGLPDTLAGAIKAAGAKYNVVLAAGNDYAALAQAVPSITVIIPMRLTGDEDLTRLRQVGGVTIAPWVDSRVTIGRLALNRDGSGRVTVTDNSVKLLRADILPAGGQFETLYASYRDKFDAAFQHRFDQVSQPLLAVGQTDIWNDPDGLDGDLRKPPAAFHPTPAGTLIAQCLLFRYHPDVVLLNQLAFRRSLGGILGFEDIASIHPFGDDLVMLGLTGTQLSDLLARNALGNRRFLETAGMTVAYTRRDPASAAVRLNGIPIEPDRVYRVLTLDYLAQGARGKEPVFTRGQRITYLGINLCHLIFDYFNDQRYLLRPYVWDAAGTAAPGSARHSGFDLFSPDGAPGVPAVAALLEQAAPLLGTRRAADAGPLRRAGEMYFRLGLWSPSAEMSEAAVAANPADAETWLLLGLARRNAYNDAGAIQALTRAAALATGAAKRDALMLLGMAEFEQARLDRARKAWRQAFGLPGPSLDTRRLRDLVDLLPAGP